MEKKRESNYDLLRIVSTIAVIAIHVGSSWIDGLRDGISAYSIAGMPANDAKLYIYIYIYIYDTLSRFAVPCFIMLSGAFILADDRNKEYGRFYRKTFAKIYVPALIFTVLYFIYSFLLQAAKPLFENVVEFSKAPDLTAPVKDLLTGDMFYHMWYLNMMIGLYLLVPVIIRFKESVSEKIFGRTALVLLILGVIGNLTSAHLLNWDIGKQILFAGYFLMGNVIKRHAEKIKKSSIKGCVFIGAGVFLELILTVFRAMTSSAETEQTSWLQKLLGVGPLAPLMVLASVCIFTGFSLLEIKRGFGKLPALTFFIYLFHGGVWSVLGNVLEILGLAHYPIVMIPLNIVIVFIISLLLTKLYLFIWNKIDDKFKGTSKNHRLKP